MSGLFLDSNVILYLLSADAKKADQAEAFLGQQPVISVQVLNEVTSVCHRKLRMPWPETQSLLDAVKASCKVVPLTVETHAKAVMLAERHQLSFYDAHILSAAIASGAHTLMSEDMQHGFGLEGLRVQNPFSLH
jgi:predicted nucleic acid-binding protein